MTDAEFAAFFAEVCARLGLRAADRQHNLNEEAEMACPVDARGVEQFIRDLREELAQQKDRKGATHKRYRERRPCINPRIFPAPR
jgi:hypothetical protein